MESQNTIETIKDPLKGQRHHPHQQVDDVIGESDGPSVIDMIPASFQAVSVKLLYSNLKRAYSKRYATQNVEMDD